MSALKALRSQEPPVYGIPLALRGDFLRSWLLTPRWGHRTMTPLRKWAQIQLGPQTMAMMLQGEAV